ncbi:MAG: hypothetical protein IH886_06220 [Nitrospinae bacterium]|nr:hypothetical protein [Nitrospinota bacterium]
MYLVLCNPEDEAALWAARGLLDRGLHVEVVSPAMLLSAPRWTLLHNDSGTRWEIHLNDSRKLCSNKISGAINRVTHVSGNRINRMAERDRNYAVQEWNAIFLAFLADIHGLVVNPPSPRWLAGYVAHEAEWHWLASQSGIPVSKYTWKPDKTKTNDPTAQIKKVLVIGDSIFGPDISGVCQESCCRLARMVNCTLLEVHFVNSDSAEWFFGATPFANLFLGGEAGIDHLATIFEKNKGVAQ